MFGSDMLTFQEFRVRETLPLSTLHQAVLAFLQGRDDVVLFGAQAVNAYVSEPRMTQDVDVMAHDAPDLAEQLRVHLAHQFQIGVRVREIGDGRGYRVYQEKTGNRHLVDIRPIEDLPQTQRIADVQVLAPADLIASKVIAYVQRQGKPKAGTDWRDLAMLLLKFPELKHATGHVSELLAVQADAKTQAVWRDLVAMTIVPEDEEDEF